MRIGVIGGTGLYAIHPDPPDEVQVDTPYGPVPLQVGPLETGATAFFLNRHGAQHGLPPHRLDPRGTIDALARCNVDAVVAVNNTGGLHSGYAPGDLMVPHDLVDLSGRDACTFHDDEVVHIDLSEPYCRHVRGALIAAARGLVADAHLHEEGVYVGVRGPRLETPAEVRWLSTLGDVVGMTGCPEAALARERGLCYASLSFVANPAAGLGGRIAAEEIRSAFMADLPRLQAILVAAAGRIPDARDCGCAAAPEAGRLVRTA